MDDEQKELRAEIYYLIRCLELCEEGTPKEQYRAGIIAKIERLRAEIRKANL